MYQKPERFLQSNFQKADARLKEDCFRPTCWHIGESRGVGKE